MYKNVSSITFNIKLFLRKQKLLFWLVLLQLPYLRGRLMESLKFAHCNEILSCCKVNSALAMLLDCQILSVITNYENRLATTVDQPLGICRSQTHLIWEKVRKAMGKKRKPMIRNLTSSDKKSFHQRFPLNRFCSSSGSCIFLYPSLLAALVLNFNHWQAFVT